MQARVLVVLGILLFFASSVWASGETVLYAFTGGNDGGNPVDAGRLLRKGTALYGTTAYGGSSGCGTIFKLSGSKLTTLYAFSCASDGSNPSSGLTPDLSGNFYGTTSYGGNDDCGTVFEFANSTLTTLYSFTCGTDGASPVGGVVRDKTGNLYGTTTSGGTNGAGVAFEIAASGAFSVIYSFCSLSACADGQYPFAGLAIDTQSNLYGTTYQGGVKGCEQNAGCGTVFKLSSSSGGWKETVLHRFAGERYQDGAYPELSTLLLTVGEEKQAVIYGVTSEGGETGNGALFQLSKAKKGYTFAILYSFAGPSGDGAMPRGSLIDEKGKLFGTTMIGGSGGYGTIFSLAKAKENNTWTETILYNFADGSDGGYPDSGVVAGTGGELYGSASAGGSNGYGVVYAVAP